MVFGRIGHLGLNADVKWLEPRRVLSRGQEHVWHLSMGVEAAKENQMNICHLLGMTVWVNKTSICIY
jgi:hypothetical protein